MARSTSFVSLLAMKLWTNSSIHICQARLFRGAGAFRFDSVGLGDGSGVGFGDASSSLGDGDGDGAGVATGVGDGSAEYCGVGTTSFFFCARHAQNAIRTAAARTIAPIANDLHFGAGFWPAVGAFLVVAGDASVSVACSSNSLMAAATGGMCFESGCERASSQWGVLR